MGAKKKEMFQVTFYGEQQIKAYTREKAREELEKMPNLVAEGGVTTNTIGELVLENFMMNMSSIVTMGVGIIYLVVGFAIYNKIAEFGNPEIRLIALMVWFMLIVSTFRFPQTIGRWYNFRRSRR